MKLEFVFVDKDQLRAELEKTRWPPGKLCVVLVAEQAAARTAARPSAKECARAGPAPSCGAEAGIVTR